MGNHRFDHEIQTNPLENLIILEKMNFQLEAQHSDDNIVRYNWSDHIQQDFEDSENLTRPSVKAEVTQPFDKYSKNEMLNHDDQMMYKNCHTMCWWESGKLNHSHQRQNHVQMDWMKRHILN